MADEALTEKMQTGTLPTEGAQEEEPEKEILTTGEDGTLTVEKLVPGTYCIQEAETVPGYLMDETVYEFTVSEDGRINGEEIGFLTVENCRHRNRPDKSSQCGYRRTGTAAAEMQGDRYGKYGEPADWNGIYAPGRADGSADRTTFAGK